MSAQKNFERVRAVLDRSRARTQAQRPRMALEGIAPPPMARTYLPPEQEARFQGLYAADAQRLGINPNPNDPLHNYDLRGAYLAGEGPDESGHWSSRFKDLDHPDRYLVDESGIPFDTATNREVPAAFLHFNRPLGDIPPSDPLASLEALAREDAARAAIERRGRDLSGGAMGLVAAPFVNTVSDPLRRERALEAGAQGVEFLGDLGEAAFGYIGGGQAAEDFGEVAQAAPQAIANLPAAVRRETPGAIRGGASLLSRGYDWVASQADPIAFEGEPNFIGGVGTLAVRHGPELARAFTYGPWENEAGLQDDLDLARAYENRGFEVDPEAMRQTADAANLETAFAGANAAFAPWDVPYAVRGAGALARGTAESVAAPIRGIGEAINASPRAQGIIREAVIPGNVGWWAGHGVGAAAGGAYGAITSDAEDWQGRLVDAGAGAGVGYVAGAPIGAIAALAPRAPRLAEIVLHGRQPAMRAERALETAPPIRDVEFAPVNAEPELTARGPQRVGEDVLSNIGARKIEGPEGSISYEVRPDGWHITDINIDRSRGDGQALYTRLAEEAQQNGAQLLMGRRHARGSAPLEAPQTLPDGRAIIRTPEQRQAFTREAMLHDRTENGVDNYHFNADGGSRYSVEIYHPDDGFNTATVQFRDGAHAGPDASGVTQDWNRVGGRSQAAALQNIERVAAAVDEHAATRAPEQINIAPADDGLWLIYKRLAQNDRITPPPGYRPVIDEENRRIILLRQPDAPPPRAPLARDLGDQDAPAALRSMPVLEGGAILAGGALGSQFIQPAEASNGEADGFDPLGTLIGAGLGGAAAYALTRGRNPNALGRAANDVGLGRRLGAAEEMIEDGRGARAFRPPADDVNDADVYMPRQRNDNDPNAAELFGPNSEDEYLLGYDELTDSMYVERMPAEDIARQRWSLDPIAELDDAERPRGNAPDPGGVYIDRSTANDVGPINRLLRSSDERDNYFAPTGFNGRPTYNNLPQNRARLPEVMSNGAYPPSFRTLANQPFDDDTMAALARQIRPSPYDAALERQLARQRALRESRGEPVEQNSQLDDWQGAYFEHYGRYAETPEELDEFVNLLRRARGQIMEQTPRPNAPDPGGVFARPSGRPIGGRGNDPGELTANETPQPSAPETGTRRERYGQRGIGSERGDEVFSDPRLTPDQSYAVQQARNNYSNAEIAEQMGISQPHVGVLLSQARTRAPDIAFDAGKPSGRRGAASIERILELRDQLRAAGVPETSGGPGGGGPTVVSIIAERLGMKPNTVSSRISQYERARRRGGSDPLAGIAIGAGGGLLAADALSGEAEAAAPGELEDARAEVDRLEAELSVFDAVREGDPASVRAAQEILVARGLDVGGPGAGPDGVFGDATRVGIRQARAQIAAELEPARSRFASLEEEAAAGSIPDNPIMDAARTVAPWAALAIGYGIGHGSRNAAVRADLRRLEGRNRGADALLPLDGVGEVIPVDRGAGIGARRARADLASNLNEFWVRGGAGERVPFRETNSGLRPRPKAAEPATLYPDEPDAYGFRSNDALALALSGGEGVFAWTQYEDAKQEVEAAREALRLDRRNPENYQRLETAINNMVFWEAAMRLGQGAVSGRLMGTVMEPYPRGMRPNVPAASTSRADLNDYIRSERAAAARRRPPRGPPRDPLQ